MNKSKRTNLGRLHILTDFHFQQRFSHAELAALAIAGGADTIQFRHKSPWIRHMLYDAHATADVCAAAHTPLIIDDHIDIALAVKATGVHLGQTDFPVKSARAILGPDRIIGATATTLDQARRAVDDGADYIGFGPVFSTWSKSNPAPVKGLDELATVCQHIPIPVIGIAGMTAERVTDVLDAGAYGMAVMTAISCAPNPQAACQVFRNAINAWLTGKP